jgi:hypothetical protein
MTRSLSIMAGLLACSQVALAQTTTAPAYDPTVAHRSIRALELWPELQGEIALHNGDYLLLTVRGERSTTEVQTNRTLGFDTRRMGALYEHFWSDSWSWGGALRYESDARVEAGSTGDMLVPELLLRHRSPIFGGFTFGQRLGVERQFYVNRHYLGGPAPGGQFWGRLRVDVERLFPLGGDAAGLALRPRLSYTASTHLRFQKEANDPEERTIQFTSLRGEVGVRLSQGIDLTPWFAYQTVYREDLIFYKDSANTIPVSGGKINAIYPTLGLDVRFTFRPAGAKADRQQLPTQH